MPGSIWVPGKRARIVLSALLGGVALGVIQPAFMTIFYGLGVVVGPTLVGVVLLVSILVAVLFGIAALAVPRARGTAVPTFLLCGSLAVGIIGGNVVGAILNVGLRSNGPVNQAPFPSFSFTAYRFLQAHATVIVSLDGEPGFLHTTQETVDGGLFGHWCYSLPDSEAVGHVDALGIGELNGRALSVFIRPDPGAGTARVVFQFLNAEDGSVPVWSGHSRVVDEAGPAGRVIFEGLTGEPAVAGWPTTLSGAVSWECAPWTAT